MITAKNGNGKAAPRHGEKPVQVVLIWIDWYAYHLARLGAVASHPLLVNRVLGIELVGGAGVHGSLVFRAEGREGLPIATLFPGASWSEVGQRRIARALWKQLDALHPEVVFVPGYYTLPGLAAVLWARLRNRKAILMSESTRQDHRRRWWLEALKRFTLPRLFDGAIGGGERTLAYLRELGFPSSAIARLYDVVDNDYFAEQTKWCRRQSGPQSMGLPAPYFLYVGRLAEEKNISGLLRAFTDYRRRGGTFSLVLVGDGPLAEPLRRQAAADGIAGSVHFAGLKDTRAIVPYYAHASWFVLPSWREPWGLVVNEAMASGLPVIVSNRCGCSEDLVKEGANGYVFDPGEEGRLADLLLQAAGLSEEQRRSMGQVSEAVIAQYAPRLWSEEVVRIAGIHSAAGAAAA